MAGYATRFHRLLSGKHGVASPLGAWLLLALVAPAAEGAVRDELAEVLGCDVEEAFAAAAELLRDPHPEIVLGSAIWHDPHEETERLLELVRRLSPPADGGPTPSQAEADAWARERTLDLIERFPLDLDSSVVLLLATAIATKVSWEVPFLIADAGTALLPAEPGFAGLPLLRDPGVVEWRGFVDSDAGLVAAFTARSQRGLFVTSVVTDPGADPVAVLDVAQQIAIGVATGKPPSTRSLFDLPLGKGTAWHIGEGVTHAHDRERFEVLLPAWEARSNHELLGDPELGFAGAVAALVALLSSSGFGDAKQAAMARYHREGFEAAAVTGVAVRLSLPPETTVRTARIEFTRPHAVVAATAGAGLWDGLPVFAAWVGQAVPAE